MKETMVLDGVDWDGVSKLELLSEMVKAYEPLRRMCPRLPVPELK
jgi:hypothetical protein